MAGGPVSRGQRPEAKNEIHETGRMGTGNRSPRSPGTGDKDPRSPGMFEIFYLLDKIKIDMFVVVTFHENRLKV